VSQPIFSQSNESKGKGAKEGRSSGRQDETMTKEVKGKGKK
jgi:hypothetical protein